MAGFVHLHVHSDFSLQDAAVSVTKLADKAERLGMSHLALTDHGNMFGAMEFISACDETINEEGKHEKRENPIKPIIGCEVYVSPSHRTEKSASESENRYYHLVLLAKNRQGYSNLIKLCSLAYTEGFHYRPRIDEELLSQYHGGLIALSACVSGEIPRLVQAGKAGEALRKAAYYRDLFGKDESGDPNFYLEIQDHGINAENLKGSLSQREITAALADIARETGIPLVATNDVHYLEREDAVAHDILICIGTGKVRSEEKRKKYHGEEFYFKSAEEMAAVFPDYPEALANTQRIAERCAADVPRIRTEDMPNYLPDFKIPLGYENADAYLRHLTLKGLGGRYEAEKLSGGEVWEGLLKRVEYELDTIIKMGFSGYFLIVADFINWAKEQNISVGPGRGSGAGSIVAYSLRITDIDPLKYGLLFERFLNPERISMPDFDVDFAKEGREDVINYVFEKYGRDKTAQIITFGKLKAKAVIKDVARVLGISIPESDMITKLIPRDPDITLKRAILSEPKLLELKQDPRYVELFLLAEKLEGLNRHSSIHAAGVVIGKAPLDDFVPLFRDKSGAITTQYSMNYLEPRGLVKMDFLGIKTLDLIKNTEELIRKRGGEYALFNVGAVSENDELTFKMLGEGNSFGVFQFESDGMQDVLKRAKPGKIEDLIALNALYRPGPMANIPRFIDSKNGKQPISYPHADLEEILKETYGVIVYQEQVMHVAQIIAGFSLGQADELRRAMGKKDMEKMVKGKKRFIAGARERGYSENKADEIFELLIPFAGYGFNKSHATGYAVLAYRTAYLKANFPEEFMAANLSNEIHSADKDKLSDCIAEARKMCIDVDPPDINRSEKLFNVVGGRIVYGLLGIKGLGDIPVEEIINCRHDGQSNTGSGYSGFMDFLNRVDIKTVGKSVIERLIQTGAFDSLGRKREVLLGNFERAVEYVQKIKDDKKYGQASLFDDSGEKEYPDFEFENFPEQSRAEKLKVEKELIGFFFSGHPMDDYKSVWQQLVKVDLGRKETILGNGAGQILVGLIKNIKPITTSRGDKMAFASLEDYNGEIELTFFTSIWEKCRDKIEADKVAILKGKIDYQQNKDKYSFTVDECLEPGELGDLIKQEEVQERKWDKYRNIWKYSKELDLRLLELGTLAKAEAGSYTIIGVIKSLRTHVDKKGNEMAFGTLQNAAGEIDLVFFSRIWDSCKVLIAVDEITALKGSIDPLGDKNPKRLSFIVSSVQDLNKLVRTAAKKAAEVSAASSSAELLTAAASSPAEVPAGAIAGLSTAPEGSEIHIRLAANAADNEANLFSLRECIDENPGNCLVYIHVPVSAKSLSGENIYAENVSLDASRENVSLDASRETIILSASKIDAGIYDSLSCLSAVAKVWQK